MADITNVFKATIKTIKTRNKAQGITHVPEKNQIGLNKSKRSSFEKRSRDLRSNIIQLRDFLADHRRDYLNTTCHVGADTSKMTDAERDQIDEDAETYIKTCSGAIKAISSEESSRGKTEKNSHTDTHRKAVLELLEKSLKGVCKMYSEQKAIRVKRVVDRKRMGRLEPESRIKRASVKEFPRSKSSLSQKEENNLVSSGSWQDKTAKEKENKPTIPVEEPPSSFDEEDEEISPEEAQMFALENQQLYEEMNTLMNEVKQIEGKVVEISRLQEIFTEKVLEQEKDIDRVADTVVGATENIKDANDEIREAMKNNAGLRVWILFFLIVCSFSLLFLDWYNP